MNQSFLTPISERISALREFMAARAETCPSVDPLQSIFLIGSCAEELTNDWYQDYDVHFLFDGVALHQETLQWMREVLLECQQMSDASCRVETFLRDRHWKMVPDRSYDSNIGIHATLLNSADHYRRLHYNSLLALNMYRRCYLIYGKHPAEIRGWRPPQLIDYSLSVGGIGWMAENFARAITLYLLSPADHTFYPFIAGYCWNVASTLMFHLYTLEQSNVIGRSKACQYFISNGACDNADRNAAELLLSERENPNVDDIRARQIINAAGRILSTIRSRVWQRLPTELRELSETSSGILYRSSLYPNWPELVREFRSDSPGVIDVLKEEDPDDYLGTVEQALTQVKSESSVRLSPKENFEFLRDSLVEPGSLRKVRVWDKASLPRRLLSPDFHIDRKVSSIDSVFFGWEDGIQALLQRLHEVHIEKGMEDPELTKLARVCFGIASNRLCSYYNRPPIAVDAKTLWQSTNYLGNILLPVLPM